MLLFVVRRIFVALHMAYYNESNILVYHHSKAALHYVRTTFITDLICVFPFELIASFALRQSDRECCSLAVRIVTRN